MKYIFQIKIKPGHTLEEYVEAWEKGSAIIQKYPGAKGTRLLQNIDEPDSLLAVADWESKELRDHAMKALGESDPEIQRIWQTHKEYGETTKIGEFNETEWHVIPQ